MRLGLIYRSMVPSIRRVAVCTMGPKEGAEISVSHRRGEVERGAVVILPCRRESAVAQQPLEISECFWCTGLGKLAHHLCELAFLNEQRTSCGAKRVAHRLVPVLHGVPEGRPAPSVELNGGTQYHIIIQCVREYLHEYEYEYTSGVRK